jgi:hypothetical protein
MSPSPEWQVLLDKKFSHRHGFVCLAGLAEQTRDHFVALFIGCALYMQEKACP